MLFGWIGDHSKTKKLPFLVGMIVVGAATLLFSLTTSLPLIVFARVMQGISTASVFTIGFSLLLDTVGSSQIGRPIGFTSMSLSLGLFAGPIIGGLIYDAAGYLAVFAPAFVLILLETLLALLLQQPASHRISPECHEHSPLLRASGPISRRRSSSSSSAPTILLRSPRFLVAMLGMCMLNTFMTAWEAVLPAYLQELLGYNASQVAVVFLSNTLPLMVLSPMAGNQVDRAGPFWPAVSGFLLAAPSMMVLGLVQTNTTLCSALLRICLFVFGCGVSMAMPAMMTEISKATEDVQARQPGVFGDGGAYSQAYGLSNAAFAMGTLAGPLYAGYVREWAGWTTMCVSLGALSLVMVLLVMLFTGQKNREGTPANP